MELPFEQEAARDRHGPQRPGSSLRSKLAIVGVSGLAFAGGIIGLSSLASAETPEPADAVEAENSDGDWNEDDWNEDWNDGELSDGELSDYDGFSAEDRTLIDRFELCIAETGIEDLGEEATFTEEDYEAIDAAFESCEPILDDLSFDSEVWLEGDDLSAEDEAVFEAYDQCLTDAGVPSFEAFAIEVHGEDGYHDDESAADHIDEGPNEELTEEDFEAIDAAFESCDPILEGLSEDMQFLDGDFEEFEISPEDEAVWENFEQCLTDAGLIEEDPGSADAFENLSEEDLDELESTLEGCEEILDDLSETGGFVIVEDAEHSSSVDA